MMFLCFFVLVAMSFCVGEATLTPKQRKSDNKFGNIKRGPQNITVFDRHLVSDSTSIREILQNYQGYFREIDHYQFDGLVLGYVTPVFSNFFRIFFKRQISVEW